MGGMAMAMDKCVDRQKKKSLTLLKQIVNISKEDMEDYHWAMLTHAKECMSLKK